MTTEVTLPIKCSTVKKVKDTLPQLLFWVCLVALVILIGYIATDITQEWWAKLIAGFIFSMTGFLILFALCPYKFKCIPE